MCLALGFHRSWNELFRLQDGGLKLTFRDYLSDPSLGSFTLDGADRQSRNVGLKPTYAA
jgi:hypothetical protein